MTSAYRGRSLWTWFGLYIGFLGAACLLAVSFGGDPHRPHGFGWDLLALAFSYGVVLTCVAAIFDGIRRIRTVDGDVDEVVTAAKTTSDAAPLRSVRSSA